MWMGTRECYPDAKRYVVCILAAAHGGVKSILPPYSSYLPYVTHPDFLAKGKRRYGVRFGFNLALAGCGIFDLVSDDEESSDNSDPFRDLSSSLDCGSWDDDEYDSASSESELRVADSDE